MVRPAARPVRYRRNNHPPTRRLNMTAHIDTLKEWWENAEVGDPKDGDVIIEWAGDGHAVRTFLEDERDDLYAACTYRILARAPKPKPAWHDAPAVIAWTDLAERQVWERDGSGTYYGTGGDVADDYEFHDVTPLIEAKVTDEMVDRIREHKDFTGRRYFASREGARHLLAIALGLETE